MANYVISNHLCYSVRRARIASLIHVSIIR